MGTWQDRQTGVLCNSPYRKAAPVRKKVCAKHRSGETSCLVGNSITNQLPHRPTTCAIVPSLKIETTVWKKACPHKCLCFLIPYTDCLQLSFSLKVELVPLPGAWLFPCWNLGQMVGRDERSGLLFAGSTQKEWVMWQMLIWKKMLSESGSWQVWLRLARVKRERLNNVTWLKRFSTEECQLQPELQLLLCITVSRKA